MSNSNLSSSDKFLFNFINLVYLLIRETVKIIED
jgi:hypothetical protein